MSVGLYLCATIDCADPEALSAFWCAVLGTEVDSVLDDGRYYFLKGSDTLPLLAFQRVDEPKTGKTRMHLDIAVTDVEAATQQVLELGGSWSGGADFAFENFAWRTVADPEGNEFDLVVT